MPNAHVCDKFKLKFSDPWTINFDKMMIDFNSPIGNGTFSVVYKGILKGKDTNLVSIR